MVSIECFTRHNVEVNRNLRVRTVESDVYVCPSYVTMCSDFSLLFLLLERVTTLVFTIFRETIASEISRFDQKKAVEMKSNISIISIKADSWLAIMWNVRYCRWCRCVLSAEFGKFPKHASNGISDKVSLDVIRNYSSSNSVSPFLCLAYTNCFVMADTGLSLDDIIKKSKSLGMRGRGGWGKFSLLSHGTPR